MRGRKKPKVSLEIGRGRSGQTRRHLLRMILIPRAKRSHGATYAEEFIWF